MGSRGDRRDTGVDVVRGLALLSMYVAHTASRLDPGPLVLLTNLLTAALFATLVGVGAGLSGSARRSTRGAVAAPLVRGAALVVLGLLLGRAGSSIIVILVHLGLLTWLVAVLARCPTWLVSVVGGALLVLSPVLRESLAGQDARLSASGAHWSSLLLDLSFTGDTYRLSSLLAWAAIGLVLARTAVRSGGAVRPLGGGVALLAVGALVVGLGGRPVPYSGTTLEVVVDALLAAGVLLVGVGATRAVGGRGLGWCADLGRTTLTLYTLQVLGLALLETRLRPGEPPYGADVLAALVAGSLLLAVGWSRLASARWGRGPIEGVVERVVDLVGGGGRRHGRPLAAQPRRHPRRLG